MVQTYLQLLPPEASSATVVALWVAAGVGTVVWLSGSVWSRWVVTLFTVMLGASIGMHMPRWFGWSISGAGPAVGMAVVLGVTGYAVHGGWVGALLGAALAVMPVFAIAAAGAFLLAARTYEGDCARAAQPPEDPVVPHLIPGVSP